MKIITGYLIKEMGFGMLSQGPKVLADLGENKEEFECLSVSNHMSKNDHQIHGNGKNSACYPGLLGGTVE